MELLLALIFGIALGLIGHFSLPGRDGRGVALLPAVGAVTGGVFWTAMTWAGATTTNALLWLGSVAIPLVFVIVVALIMARLRRRADARLKEQLRLP